MQRVFSYIVTVLLTGWILIATASAADYLYDHNGSRMRVNVEGNKVKIYYQKPRQGLAGAGVRAGTLLFDGKVSNGYLEGMSRIFNPNCGEVDYFVYGDFTPGRSFMLNGAAPVLSNMSCRIVDNVYEGDNANLRFSAIGKSSQTPLSKTNQGGASCVVGVNTSLNVRVGPGADYGRIGELPANVCGLKILDRCQDDWCVVAFNDLTGWVSMRYIRR